MTRTLIASFFLAASQVAFAQQCGSYTVEELRRSGGRVDWSPGPGDMIAFDQDEDADGYFDVSTMSLADRSPVCLTCTPAAIAQLGEKRNKGQPAWHPSGEYIVFQAQIAESEAGSKKTNPGRGVDNVLWLTDKHGTWFVQLTQFSEDAIGVLHPHFHVSAEEGTRLSWSEMYAKPDPLKPGHGAGLWRLKKAKLNLDTFPPRLEQAVTLPVPMRDGFYENHGFSPDGKLVIFSSNAMRSGLLDSINNDIFTFELESGVVKRLTETRYNEHASFFPDGRRVLWMSNRNNPGRGTDLWVMDSHRPRADEQRLTYFNREGCPGADGGMMIAADSSLNPSGDALVVFVQPELFADGGPIFLVRFQLPF